MDTFTYVLLNCTTVNTENDQKIMLIARNGNAEINYFQKNVKNRQTHGIRKYTSIRAREQTYLKDINACMERMNNNSLHETTEKYIKCSALIPA